MNDVAQHVLDRWAQRAAAKDIQSELATSGIKIKAIYRIIEQARAMQDSRATFRKGRDKVGRVVEKKRKAGRRIKEAHAALEGWWFGSETVMVRRLGVGSHDCTLVAVSVSCVPSRIVRSEARPQVQIFKSFAEAFGEPAEAGPPL